MNETRKAGSGFHERQMYETGTNCSLTLERVLLGPVSCWLRSHDGGTARRSGRAAVLWSKPGAFVLEQEAFPERIAPDVAVIVQVKIRSLLCIGITGTHYTHDTKTIRSAEGFRFVPPGIVLSKCVVLDRRC